MKKKKCNWKSCLLSMSIQLSRKFSYMKQLLTRDMDLNNLPSQTEHSDQNIKYNFQFTEWIFKPLGLWWIIWHTKQNKFNKFLTIFLIFLNIFAMLFTIIPSGIYMIFNEKILAKKIVLFGPIGFTLTNFIKYCLIICRMKIINQCFEHIKTDWRTVGADNDRARMIENVNFSRNFTSLCTIFMFSGGLSYHTIMPMWGSKSQNNENSKTRPHHVYSGYDTFFNSQATPAYELIYFAHVLGAVITYIITTAACNLAAITAGHICGQVDIVNSRLQMLVNKENIVLNNTIENKIARILKHHVRILRFSIKMEKMLREICLIEVLASTLIICLLEYYCMTEWNNSETIAIITYFMLLMSLSFNIFIFCYIGEVIQEQCASIGKTTYMINWYNISGKKVLSLLLIIAMANKPRKITAGGLMNLNIRGFGRILKTSFMYLNMLRTITD